MYMNLKKWKIILLIIVFLFSISFSVINIYNHLKFKNIEYNFNIVERKSILEMNKIIIIGDSRMELIELDRDKLNITSSIMFDAISGAKIDWLYSTGIPKLYELISNDNYKYTVIFNLGVNDLDSDINPNQIAKDYFDIYKKIINQNKSISFYFLSVNPIDEYRIYNYFSKSNKRTNYKINQFNNYFINRLEEEKLENVEYCDSSSSLIFVLPDGLHYDFNTNKNIINYIINDCVNIEKLIRYQ